MTRHHPDLSSASYRLKLSTNEKHYPDLGSDASSVWNFCSCSSDVISRGNKTKKWWRHENSKTRLPLFFPTRLTAPGSPRMEIKTKRTKRWKHSIYFKFTGKGGPSTHCIYHTLLERPYMIVSIKDCHKFQQITKTFQSSVVIPKPK